MPLTPAMISPSSPCSLFLPRSSVTSVWAICARKAHHPFCRLLRLNHSRHLAVPVSNERAEIHRRRHAVGTCKLVKLFALISGEKHREFAGARKRSGRDGRGHAVPLTLRQFAGDVEHT